MRVPEVLGSGDYIFNVPSVHIDDLRVNVYPSFNECATVCYQEIGEFLQALGKYQLLSKSSPIEERHDMRMHIIEEMTHVLICLAMIARSFGVTQDEIDTEIKKKAIPGIKYPFYIEKQHISIDDLLKGLNHCVHERSADQKDSEYDCNKCIFCNEIDFTLTCRPMIQAALYYLKQYGDYKQSVKLYQKNEK